MPQAGRALVTLLGGLGEQLEHDLGQERGNRRDERVRRDRLLGDVAIDPLDGIAGPERQGARQHLVEDDAQGVEIGPLVDPAVHPACLLRGHVRQRPLDEPGVLEVLELAGYPGRNPQIGDLHLAGGGVEEQVLRLDVLVDDVVPVQRGERLDQAEGEGEEALERHRPIQEPIERHAAEILQDQRRLIAEHLERIGLDDGRGVERPGDLVLVAQPLEGARARVIAPEDLEHHGTAVVLAYTPVKKGV